MKAKKISTIYTCNVIAAALNGTHLLIPMLGHLGEEIITIDPRAII